jgi:hypothetical protein
MTKMTEFEKAFEKEFGHHHEYYKSGYREAALWAYTYAMKRAEDLIKHCPQVEICDKCCKYLAKQIHNEAERVR